MDILSEDRFCRFMHTGVIGQCHVSALRQCLPLSELSVLFDSSPAECCDLASET